MHQQTKKVFGFYWANYDQMCIIPGPLIQQSIKNYCLFFYSFQKDHKKKAAEIEKENINV